MKVRLVLEDADIGLTKQNLFLHMKGWGLAQSANALRGLTKLTVHFEAITGETTVVRSSYCIPQGLLSNANFPVIAFLEIVCREAQLFWNHIELYNKAAYTQ